MEKDVTEKKIYPSIDVDQFLIFVNPLGIYLNSF